jgi:hypothetical protein
MGDRDGVESDQGEALASLSTTASGELVLAMGRGAEFAWALRQGDALVGQLRTDADPAIVVAGEAWNADIHQGGRGWWAELTREGTGETIAYRPRVLSGGNLEGGGARYRLRSRLLLGDWRLRDDSGGEVARIPRLLRRENRIELGDSAAREPRLAVVLLAACLAILWDSMTPHVHADGGGP